MIGILGGVNAASRLLGHKSASTVQGWWERGFIPGNRQREVLEAAQQAGFAISERDFFVHLAPLSREEGDCPNHEGSASAA